jgi:hypothetical protein
MLRLHLNDEQKINWSADDELIEFLDNATAFITNLLIRMRHNSLIKVLDVNGPTELPQDFVSFVGKQPIQIIGGLARPYGRIDNNTSLKKWKDANVSGSQTTPVWMDKATTWQELTTNQNFNTLYWSRLPYVSDFLDEDKLPYTKEFAGQILDIARILALNKNEYDTQQDVALAQQVQNALSAVIAGDSQ